MFIFVYLISGNGISKHSAHVDDYLFGSLVTYFVDKDGAMIIYLSKLAQYFKNSTSYDKLSIEGVNDCILINDGNMVDVSKVNEVLGTTKIKTLYNLDSIIANTSVGIHICF